MMKYIIYIGILLSAAGCAAPEATLQPGDLLFQAGKNTEMAGAITAATGKQRTVSYTHVGIVTTTQGADSVIEATEGGVRTIALREFLDNAGQIDGRPAVVAMRLRDTTGVAAALRRARSCVGLPYDYLFLPDNGCLYCSELVWESFRKQDGTPRFPARPMNFRAADGSMPRFWSELFAAQGMEVPEGVPGTNPNDMARDPQLKEVRRWF